MLGAGKPTSVSFASSSSMADAEASTATEARTTSFAEDVAAFALDFVAVFVFAMYSVVEAVALGDSAEEDGAPGIAGDEVAEQPVWV